MGLRDRLQRVQQAGATAIVNGMAAAGPSTAVSVEIFQELKGEMHQRLIDTLDLRTIDQLPREQLRDELRLILGGVLAGTFMPFSSSSFK